MLGDLTGSATVYGLPRSHWHCSLENFDWTEHPKHKKHLADLLPRIEAGEAPHVLMTGPPGLGKTHLAVGLYRWAVARWDLTRVRFVHVPSFCDEVKASFDETGGPDPFADAGRAERLLVLDDIFGRDLSPWETGNVIPRLVGAAYRNDAALVATMNPSVKQAGEHLHSHEMSRLLQGAEIWQFEGEDHRLK